MLQGAETLEVGALTTRQTRPECSGERQSRSLGTAPPAVQLQADTRPEICTTGASRLLDDEVMQLSAMLYLQVSIKANDKVMIQV